MREDTLTVSGDVDGQLSPKATKKVLRPLQASGLAALSVKDPIAARPGAAEQAWQDSEGNAGYSARDRR